MYTADSSKVPNLSSDADLREGALRLGWIVPGLNDDDYHQPPHLSKSIGQGSPSKVNQISVGGGGESSKIKVDGTDLPLQQLWSQQELFPRDDPESPLQPSGYVFEQSLRYEILRRMKQDEWMRRVGGDSKSFHLATRGDLNEESSRKEVEDRSREENMQSPGTPIDIYQRLSRLRVVVDQPRLQSSVDPSELQPLRLGEVVGNQPSQENGQSPATPSDLYQQLSRLNIAADQPVEGTLQSTGQAGSNTASNSPADQAFQQSMTGLPQVPASDLTQSNLLELLLKQQQLRLMMHNTLLQSLTQLLTSEQTELLRHTLTTDSLVPNEMANTPISPKSQSSSVLSPHSLGAFFDISNWLSAIHPLGRTTRSSDNVAGGFEVFFAFFPVSRFWILNHVLI